MKKNFACQHCSQSIWQCVHLHRGQGYSTTPPQPSSHSAELSYVRRKSLSTFSTVANEWFCKAFKMTFIHRQHNMTLIMEFSPVRFKVSETIFSKIYFMIEMKDIWVIPCQKVSENFDPQVSPSFPKNLNSFPGSSIWLRFSAVS